MSFKVAIQVYSVRDDAEKDLKGTLQKIKEMGYDGVEFAGLYGHSYQEVRDMVKEVGLVPISAHIPLNEMLADPEGVLAGYAEIGCSYAAVPYLPDELRAGTSNFEKTLQDIAMLGKVASQNHMVMLYHNHDFEFQKIGEEYVLDYMYRTIPSNLLQTEIDTCWVNVAGENPAEYVRKYTGRAPIVHLKDFYLSNRDQKGDSPFYELIGNSQKAGGEDVFEFRPVGYGMQDFSSILKASEEAGAEWVIVEQDRPSMGKTPMECAEMSRNYLKTLGV